MHVEARKLRLTNIGQLIEVALTKSTIMGKLERVQMEASGEVVLRISGNSVTVPEAHKVNIRRSGELHELHIASLGVEDLLDSAGVGG